MTSIPLGRKATLAALNLERSVAQTSHYRGGTREARKHLHSFRNRGLVDYARARNDPAEPRCSSLSPYLHFGQISPVEAAVKVIRTENCSLADREAFLEQLIVRRELAINYVLHEPRYDRYAAIPEWARRTLREHAGDHRLFRYPLRTLESASTHDVYWNAAMKEMVKTGYMHNYMRMYWGKKIIEWSATPELAYRRTLTLNNKYFIDGRDANSYTSVAWLFGLHDRPWTERAIFGKIRYMNAAGLERKFDIQAYVGWVENLALHPEGRFASNVARGRCQPAATRRVNRQRVVLLRTYSARSMTVSTSSSSASTLIPNSRSSSAASSAMRRESRPRLISESVARGRRPVASARVRSISLSIRSIGGTVAEASVRESRRVASA